MIMGFYLVLTYIAGPLVFYYFVNRSLASAGNGFVFGSLLSVVLWFSVGSSMAT
jgi:hypothetical protein